MKAGIGFTKLFPAEQPLREGARQRRRMDPRGGLKTNVKLSVTHTCHFEQSEKSLSFAARDSRCPHVPRTFPLFSSVFHTASALSAPAGHLPLEGKAGKREYPLLKRRRTTLVIPSAPRIVIPSAAEESLLHCRHMHTCALTPSRPHANDTLVRPFSPFSHSRLTFLQKGSLHFGPHDKQNTNHLT